MKACLGRRKGQVRNFLLNEGREESFFGVKGVKKVHAYLEPLYLEGI